MEWFETSSQVKLWNIAHSLIHNRVNCGWKVATIWRSSDRVLTPLAFQGLPGVYISIDIDPSQTLSRTKHIVNNKCTNFKSKPRLIYRTRAAIVFLLKDQSETNQSETNQSKTNQSKTKTTSHIGSVSRPCRPNVIRVIWGASTYDARGEWHGRVLRSTCRIVNLLLFISHFLWCFF